jgi:hypothetical protein
MKVARNIVFVLPLLTATFLFSTLIALGQSTFTVRGQVVDPSGAWVPGASVRLYSAQGVHDLRADGDGKFQFTNLPKGAYELEASSSGFVAGTVDFEIAEKAPEPFSILLRIGEGGGCSVLQHDSDRVVSWVGVRVSYKKRSDKMDLVGVERDQFGFPLPGVMVKLVKQGTPQETVANEKGEFTFSGLELGKYSLQSTHAGYQDLPTTVWITRENIVKAVVTLVESWRFCGGKIGPNSH